MNIDIPEPEVEPVLCDICGEEIKVDDKFIEVKTNKGVRAYDGRGYVKGQNSLVWDTEINYVHFSHVLHEEVV